jgi:hypothetical protein
VKGLVLLVVDDVAARLSRPRRWTKQMWGGIRPRHGDEPIMTGALDDAANCWCISGAISRSISDLGDRGKLGGASLAELRDEIEDFLWAVLNSGGEPCVSLPSWNDAPGRKHEDVVALLVAAWFVGSEAA